MGIFHEARIKADPASLFKSSSKGILQRKCDLCPKRKKLLQRFSERQVGIKQVPPIVTEVLKSSGQALEQGTQAYFESKFGHSFSRVRVHTDARAADSAKAVDANAYSVGNDIVFGAERYAPDTRAGLRLLAHELTHVVQQGNFMKSLSNTAMDDYFPSQTALEIEADRNASALERDAEMTSRLQGTGDYLMREQAGGGGDQEQAASRPEIIRRAIFGAWMRCQDAHHRLVRIGIPPPPGRMDPTEANWQRARYLAAEIFGEILNMDQVAEIVGAMKNHLSPGLATVDAVANDPDCGNRAAYVRGHMPPVHLCPRFYTDSPEQQIRTMIHEAAHLAGIREPGAQESYCPIFDCQTSCGGFDVADSWAHYVYCLSGQTPDNPETVQP